MTFKPFWGTQHIHIHIHIHRHIHKTHTTRNSTHRDTSWELLLLLCSPDNILLFYIDWMFLVETEKKKFRPVCNDGGNIHTDIQTYINTYNMDTHTCIKHGHT